MAREMLVDTGAWLALVDRGDNLHAAATDAYPTVLRAGHRLVTTNLIIAESYTLIRRRVGHDAAVRFLDSLHASTRLEVAYSDRALERGAEAILRQYADQRFSYVDAVSFALMRARDIDAAFAFDRHFVTAGFRIVPG